MRVCERCSSGFHPTSGRPQRFCSRDCAYPPVGQTFWTKVATSNGCWLWKGAHTAKGYGHLTVRGKHALATHVAFALSRGYLPTNHILHSCDVTLCVRPSHLFEGTVADNMQDMIRKGRAGWQRDPERWRETSRRNTTARWANRGPIRKYLEEYA